MSGFVTFLRGKLAGYSLRLLLRLELESLLFGLFGLIPTTAGVFLRAGIAKLMFAQCDGICWIQPGVTLVHTGRLAVGKTLGINSGTYLNAIGGITLGDHVLIGSNVTISSGKHPIDGREPPIFTRPTVPLPIVIEDDVWIGAGAVIMPGVRLGRGSVIGANAVVTRDTAPYSVNVGVPAQAVRERKLVNGES